MSILKRESCNICGSQDNLVTHENGSIWCYTPGCEGNKKIKNVFEDNSILDSNLLQGSFSALPLRRISQRTCEFFNYQVGTDKQGRGVQIANYEKSQKVRTKDK